MSKIYFKHDTYYYGLKHLFMIKIVNPVYMNIYIYLINA